MVSARYGRQVGAWTANTLRFVFSSSVVVVNSVAAAQPDHRPRASKLDRREGKRVECGGHRQQRVHACHRCKYRRNRVDLGVAVDHNAVDQVAGLSDQFGERDRLRDGGDSLERRGLPAW